MELKRVGSQPSAKGPQEYFTGTVRIDPLNAPPAPARVSVASVTFEPGARSAWHTHPLGQTLVVTAGCLSVGLRTRASGSLGLSLSLAGCTGTQSLSRLPPIPLLPVV